MQKNNKIFLKMGLLLLIIFVSLLILNDIFMKKNTNSQAVNCEITELPYLAEKWDGFYEKDRDTIDMLFVGTSVVHTGVDVNYLYQEYGFTSYNLSADQMAGSNIYYFLKEAVKYQSPKVIFVDVQSLSHADSFQSASLHYSYDYMRQGIDRIQGINEQPVSIRSGNYFPFIEYHSRWEELEETDFQYMFQDKLNMLNGYFIYMISNDSPVPESYEKTDKTLSELGYGRTEETLNKIVSFCREKGVECVLIRTPQSYSEKQARYCDALQKYTDENDIVFWNFNNYYDEIGIDFSTDFVDGQHLNLAGSRKLTVFMGKWISEQFEYTDHRGAKGYEEWDAAFDYENYLIHAYDIRHYWSAQQYLTNNDFLSDELIYIYTYDNSTDIQSITGIPEISNKIRKKTESHKRYVCIVEKGEIFMEMVLPLDETWKDYSLLPQAERLMIESFDGKIKVWFGDRGIEAGNNNGVVELIIYDKKLGKILDHNIFDMNNNCYLAHLPVE